jgi:D-cysteine desulfhydrase
VDTPIQNMAEIHGNRVYIKREDLIPFSFGGNKARKAQLFFEEIDRGDHDCVVTYGSGSSNHCRVVANMAAARKMACYIISPEEASGRTYNSDLMEAFGAEITVCPVSDVHDTIENKLTDLRKEGHNPFFIAGGGHGNTGTQAYVDCYEEIRRFEREHQIHFDYIFHASGTGTTQAGLVCGQLINRDDRKIIGISIARKNPRGRNVVLDSIREYLSEQRVHVTDDAADQTTVFIDDYIGDGYGARSSEVDDTIKTIMTQHGIPLDPTYTGKAFTGMADYISQNSIKDKDILFIHTGGTPLFFDGIRGVINEI